MGLVNLRYYAGRKSPWRAQWSEPEGEELRSRTKWFAGGTATEPPREALDFKRRHEEEGERFGALAVSEVDRARLYEWKRQAAASGLALEAVLQAGLKALAKAVAKSESLETARDLWSLDARDRNLRPETVRAMRRTINVFMRGRAQTPVSDFTGVDLLRFVETAYRDQVTRDGELGRLLTFFRWCAGKTRAWAKRELFDEVKFEHRAKKDQKRVGFYKATEAHAYLNALPARLKLAVATGFFLGVRPFELVRLRLHWRHEGETYGFDDRAGKWRLAPAWTKTRDYRELYAIPDCWWYWWIKYGPTVDPIGPLNPRRANARAGFLVPCNYRKFKAYLQEARARAGITRNPKDGIRHSFGTHAFHRTREGERGVEWAIGVMGHVSGFRLFDKRYNGKVDDFEAEAYFLIYPDGAACDVKTRRRIIA